MKRLVIGGFVVFFLGCFYGQTEPVEVADLTLKVGGLSTEELYYGFEAGDEILFSFEEAKGKPLKEIEIVELPSQSKFMDFKTAEVTNKKIKVNKRGVYQFRFTNSSVKGKICKIHIQRVPATAAQVDFNTGWEWKTVYDTTYTPYTEDSVVGYDTTYVPYTKKELVKVDTTYDQKEQVPRVHTRLNSNGDKTHVLYSFPKNINTKLHTRKVIAWGYFIGTDEKEPVVSNVAGKVMRPVFAINPVAGLALGAVSILTSTNGNNLNYYIIKSYENVSAFYAENYFKFLDGADVSMAANGYEGNWQGTVYVCLDNDHTYPVDVRVIVSSVMVNYYYEMKEHQEMKLTPQYITLNKQKMNVTTSQVRVNVGG